jgi:hypothetical protein
VLQSAANVARQDMLLVYTGAAAAQSFNDEYVRASMVNTLAITNKVGARPLPRPKTHTALRGSFCAGACRSRSMLEVVGDHSLCFAVLRCAVLCCAGVP